MMAESIILWTHCTMNCNDTALQMAWTRKPVLHHKPDGAVLDPHGSTCCPSGCPCMFSFSSPSGVSLCVSVPSLSSPAFFPTSTPLALSILRALNCPDELIRYLISNERIIQYNSVSVYCTFWVIMAWFSYFRCMVYNEDKYQGCQH